MDKAVAIYNKVDRAYDTISYNFSAEANLLSNDLNVFATRIFQDRAALNEAITTLADAIEGAQAVIDAINELESKKADWGTALESSPEGDEFTTSTQAEYDNISELFKVEEVQALKDRLSQIKSVIDEVYPHIDNYKYGSKKLYDIRDLNNMRSAVNVKTSASYPGKTISEPPIIKTDLDRFHVDIFNSNYFVGAFNGRNRENINFRDDPPEFFKYLHANFANSTEDEGKKDELINNTNDMAADAADDVADATSGNSSVSFVFDKVALNLPSGDAGALVPESANANIGSNDSDSLEDDAGKEALSNNSNFITELFSGFGDIISDFGISMRDNLYVTEYGLKMFSHDTFENEIRYNMAEAAQKTDLGQMMSLNAAELTEEQKEKAITMTTVPISAENNAAYGAEVEYIIFGKQNAKDNVTIAYTSIFGIRFVLNSIYAFTDSEIRTTTLTIATPISAATLGVIPVPLIQAVLQIAIALAETTYDLLCLSEGMPVPIYKNKKSWVMSPSGLTDKMAGVAAGLAKNVVDESAVYLQEVLDKTDQELTELGEEGLRKLDESLERAFTSILDNAVGGVVIQATEACRQAVEKANAAGQDAMSKVDEVKASLDASLSNYIAEEPNPELKDAKEKAKNIILNGGTDYVKSIIETMQNKANASLEEVQAKLQRLTNSISVSISTTITNNINSMFNKYKEEAINSIKDSISSGQTALKKSIDEAFGKFGGSGGGTGAPGAGSAASSIFSFKYSDYLKLFLFIGCFANGDGVVKRMADVVQVNVAQKLEHPVGDGFLMSEAYTYARISADIEVKPLLITIPLIAETIKNDQTDTSWYKFKYSGIRSY
ncbi:MAG: hypothetical protein BWY74_03175 [Firmicutes bacterium ADurb.Bin419]|nr:MAG: hypothetical protein BWY74_03175 [Firmicutes bacterium ADurb.Bin419]